MPIPQMSRVCCLCAGLGLMLGFARPAAAQTAPPPRAGPPPLMVPLSGRTTSPGAVVATQTPVPGPTTGVNTLNPTIEIQGAFGGAVPGSRRPFSGTLTFREAVERGLEFNLGAINTSAILRQARGERAQARSALLPNLLADTTVTREQLNLAILGLPATSRQVPGFVFPTVTGPFNIVDFRARLSQSVLDLTAWHNYRSAAATVRADELSVEDTRDLIVLGVGGLYLQAVAVGARVDSARAQLETANALYEQNSQRRAVGLVAQLDVDRSQVQALTQQQRLLSLQADFAKQKITLARMVGLPPIEDYDLDRVRFATAPTLALEAALRQAHEQRADLKAAGEQVEAAERAVAAARAQRIPSVNLNADVGAVGNTPAQARGTFTIVGGVRVPIWLGGQTEAQIQQAEAAVVQRRAELQDLGSQIEGDVRKAFLDLQAVAAQVDVADKSRQVASEALALTRQRFDAGVSDNVEVIQAQEALANAELDYINSIFSHNVAKLSLARAVGYAPDRVVDFVLTTP